MEIPTELFNHFTSAHLLLLKDEPSQKQYMDQGRVTLDRKQTQELESGYLVAQYLLKLNLVWKKIKVLMLEIQIKPIEKLNTVALGALKSSHNPTSRLFNWNTTLKECEKLGVKVDADQKSLIVSGDHECILEVIQGITEFEKRMVENMKLGNRSISKRKKQKEGDQPIDIVSLNPERALNETESTLEYIIVSLCQALALQPKQAAGLLTNHNHYLLHACIKGVKSNYEQILNWYQLIYTTSKHISSLTMESFAAKTFHGEDNNKASYMLLNALKCGFFSESITVAEWTCKLFAKIAQDFDSNSQLSDLYQWYVQNPTQKNGQLGGGFEATLYALNKHPQIVENVTLQIVSTFRGQFDKIIPEIRTNHAKKNLPFLPQLLCELLPYLMRQNKEDTINILLDDSGIIQECIKNSDPDNKPESLLRAQSLSLLAEIWSLEPSLIQENKNIVEEGESLLDSTLKVFKRGCRDPSRPLRISTLGLIFKLLDQFAMVRNNQAPVLYKILTFSLIENIEDEVTREFMMNSFSEIYQNHHAIPVIILVEPLLRIMQVNEKPYPLNIFDFEFYSNLAKHPKLTAAPFGLQLMDQFAKIYLNSPLWAQPASVPLVILADRFQQDQNIQDFLMKFVSITLTSILSLKRAFELVQTKGKPKQLALASSEGGGPNLSEEDDHTKKIRRFNIVAITKKILNLKISEEFNDQIKEMVLNINRRHKHLYGTMNKGLVHLLEFWFAKGKAAMDDYIKQMDDIEKKQIEDEEKRQAKAARNEEVARIKAKYYHQDSKEQKGFYSDRDFENASQVSGQPGSPGRQGSQGAMRALVPWIHKEPKNPIEKKAIQQIETIRQKRDEKVFKQKMDEEKKKALEERKKQNLQEELSKRKYEMGLIKKEDNQQVAVYQATQDTPRVQNSAKPSKQSELEQIRLLDLENDEEDREKDGVKILLQKYQKPFKFLFNKYAMSRSQHKKVQSFDYYGDKTINLAEVNKMLRDHDITQNMISKDHLQAIIRLLNNRLYKRLDLSALDFGAYMQLIVQISHFIYQKNYAHLSPSEMVLKLIQHFEKATRSRGQSTLLYDDPDITSIGDQDVLKEMNRRLRDNPDMLIPEGFYKVTEKEQIFTYKLPDYLDIPEEQKICIEVLDQIMSENMGFHILEALVTYEQRIKAKPRIKQAGNLMPAQNASLQYMKPVEKKTFIAPNQSNQSSSQIQKRPVPVDQYKRPQLGVDLKLALYQLQKNYSTTNERNQLHETAEVLEEILQAVEQERDTLPEREKIKFTKDVWNKAKEDKKLKELEERDIERQREEKRQKRKQQLQEELEKQKEEKKTHIEETKKAQQDREREEKEKSKQQKEESKKKFEQRKLVTEDTKKQKIDELQQKKQEEEFKKFQEIQAKKQASKEFMQKQKEKLGQEFQKKKKEMEDTEKAKQEFEEWKKEKQHKVKTQMESYIKQNKDQSKAEARERQQIKEFYNQPDVKSVFIKYERALEYMFKFYASQDKKEISFNLGQLMQMINFNEFIKFGYQTYITPTIVSNDDMVMIFRALVRERREDLSQKEIDEMGTGVNSMNFEDFKRALIRVAIIGQDLLGGKGGQRLEAKLLEKLEQNQGKPPKIATRSRGRSIISSAATSKRNLLQKQNSTSALGENQTSRQQSTSRKTKEQKIIEDLQKEKERQEKMMNVKIEDKRMSRPFDVSIISAHTIEGLLKFIQLQPEDNPHKLDKKLNQQRIEIQGQKPNKVKKSLVLSQQEATDIKNKSMQDDGQQAQGGGDSSNLHEVDINDLNSVSGVEMDKIISPDGKQENWEVKKQQ